MQAALPHLLVILLFGPSALFAVDGPLNLHDLPAVPAERTFYRAVFPDGLIEQFRDDPSRSDTLLGAVSFVQVADNDRHTLIATYLRNQKSPPAPFIQIPPVMPSALRAANHAGRVKSYLLISAEGRVEEVYLSEYSDPLFARAATLALKRWTYKPTGERTMALAVNYWNHEEPFKRGLESATEASNPTLRQELLERLMKDQAVRNQLSRTTDRAELNRLTTEMRAVDADNRTWMIALVDQQGWPNRETVGTDGMNAAFILVQHADLELQQRLLPEVKHSYEAGELPPGAYALLLDRILVRSGKPQIYGSQAKSVAEWLDGNPVLHEIEDLANVDARRARMSLPPLADYIASLKQLYVKPASP